MSLSPPLDGLVSCMFALLYLCSCFRLFDGPDYCEDLAFFSAVFRFSASFSHWANLAFLLSPYRVEATITKVSSKFGINRLTESMAVADQSRCLMLLQQYTT